MMFGIQVTSDDIGRRVSFQFELPNGYPGEAVGLLEAFDEAAQTYLVPKRDSELARVAAPGVRCGGSLARLPRPICSARSKKGPP